MVENLVGKAQCYDICPLGHQCFGGYLSENPLCDKEVDRINSSLKVLPGVSHVIFAPANNIGLRFLITAEGKQKQLILADGIIK